MHKYRHQLYLYKLLVEHSHSFAGYTVSDAYLEFIEPDRDGEIVELHLSLEDEALDRARHLAETVWRHIQDLDFPDCTGYSKGLSGTKQFEDDLLAGIV